MEKNIGAVMVVGAGIGGIQASLDLAESGFKVYLVDKKPGIGGVMAQLAKLFLLMIVQCAFFLQSF